MFLLDFNSENKIRNAILQNEPNLQLQAITLGDFSRKRDCKLVLIFMLPFVSSGLYFFNIQN